MQRHNATYQKGNLRMKVDPLFLKNWPLAAKTLFLLVDVDEVKGAASKMEVEAMPTFLLIREGDRVDMLAGANPDELRKRIHAFVQSKLLLT
ncbi:Thioredoxin domain [Dillenia turbinata]|uniref:Thioredoxin domain n=1 Tax=Dillenia turbinata TaxID=194707 RepID=A0AAN8W630_9MAGN